MQTVVLSNGGLSALNVSSVAITSGQFSVTSDCVSKSPIRPGNSCNITAEFSPSLGGTAGLQTQTGTIQITDDAPSNPQMISLMGFTDTSAVTITPATLIFGTQPVGTGANPQPPTSPSAAQMVTLTNTSANDTIQITAVIPDNSNPLCTTNNSPACNFCSDLGQGDQFCNIIPVSTCSTDPNNPASQVGPGQSCQIALSAMVGPLGPASGTLQISDAIVGSQTSEDHTVALTGYGGTSGLTLNPASFAFPNLDQSISLTSAAQSVELSQNAVLPGTETINGVSASAGFTYSTCQAGVGALCNVDVEFSPVVPGFQVGSVVVAENVGTGTQVIALSGTDLGPGVTLSSSMISFPSTPVETTAAAQVLMLTNSGNQPLSFSGISASAGFAVDPTTTTCSTSSPVAAGASCSIGVTFKPAAAWHQ